MILMHLWRSDTTTAGRGQEALTFSFSFLIVMISLCPHLWDPRTPARPSPLRREGNGGGKQYICMWNGDGDGDGGKGHGNEANQNNGNGSGNGKKSRGRRDSEAASKIDS